MENDETNKPTEDEAISQLTILKLSSPKDLDSYIRLRLTLDHLRDMALAEYALIPDDSGRENFVKALTANIGNLITNDIRNRDNKIFWGTKNKPEFMKDMGVTTLPSSKEECPPGFILVGDVCVRAPGSTL